MERRQHEQVAPDEGASESNFDGEPTYSDRELVFEKFADTPMAYTVNGVTYKASGSLEAIMLCEFLQNDKLPAAFFEIKFQEAADLISTLNEDELEVMEEVIADEADSIEETQSPASSSEGDGEQQKPATETVTSPDTSKPSDSTPSALAEVQPVSKVAAASANSAVVAPSSGRGSPNNTRDKTKATSLEKKIESASPQKKIEPEKPSLDTKEVKKAEVTPASFVDDGQTGTKHVAEKAALLNPNLAVGRPTDVSMDAPVPEEVTVPVEAKLADEELILHSTNVEPSDEAAPVDHESLLPGVDTFSVESTAIDDEQKAIIQVEQVDSDENSNVENELDQIDLVELDDDMETDDVALYDDISAFEEIDSTVLNQPMMAADMLDEPDRDTVFPELSDTSPELFADLAGLELEPEQATSLNNLNELLVSLSFDNDTNELAEASEEELTLSVTRVDQLFQCLEAQVMALPDTKLGETADTEAIYRTLVEICEEADIDNAELIARLYLQTYGPAGLLDIVQPDAVVKTRHNNQLIEKYRKIARFATRLTIHHDEHALPISPLSAIPASA